MNEIKNIVIVGIGAIGAIYGVAFKKNKEFNLSVLVSAERKKRYEHDGILFNQERYDFNYVLPEYNDMKADLIIVATKADGLKEAVDMMQNYVGENTIILSLLNGISSENIIAERYDWRHVVYGLYFGHGSIRLEKGIINDGNNVIQFGEEEESEKSERIASLRSCFDKAGIKYVVPEDMLYAMWRKFMLNVGCNQATVIFDTDYSTIQNIPEARLFVKALMNEVSEIAEKVGIANTQQMLQEVQDMINELPPTTTPSMYQDYKMKRPMEVDLFAGEVCRLGRRYNVPTPYNDMIRQILTIINEKNKG